MFSFFYSASSHTFSKPRYISDILMRRCALTFTAYKFLDIGIVVGPTSHVEIVICDNRGNRIILPHVTRKAFIESRADVELLMQGLESEVVAAEVEMTPVLERAPSGSERNGSDADDARAHHKRNRSGAQKRRAKRDKEKAPEGQAPARAPTFPAVSSDGVKCPSLDNRQEPVPAVLPAFRTCNAGPRPTPRRWCDAIIANASMRYDSTRQRESRKRSTL
ncbi:hypothetical protein ALC57_16858 [Trachymyrmex cornetzi]|uniref:Uncharacterized protein n=1 Tax=Trachymyrmex cornetzi TaxID=471704 RepID=A0A151IU90_9HYME|nr:hypothetical protein ALC57_16858 [Trachymyrmex cornetzi]